MHQVHPGGLWEAPLDPSAAGYRLEAVYGGPGSPGFVFDDPYRHWPTLGDLDFHLFNEGRHRRLWEVLGAHPRTHEGVPAPLSPSGRRMPKRSGWSASGTSGTAACTPCACSGNSGVWELFVPGVEAGSQYKYEIVTADERLVLKADPFAFATEVPPGTASVVAAAARPYLGRQRVDGEEGPKGDPLVQSDVDVRGPPRIVALDRATARREPPAHLPGTGRPATCVRGRDGLHPRGVPARGRAPLRRVMGLPGERLLRPDRPLREPGRLPGTGGRPAPGRE